MAKLWRVILTVIAGAIIGGCRDQAGNTVLPWPGGATDDGAASGSVNGSGGAATSGSTVEDVFPSEGDSTPGHPFAGAGLFSARVDNQSSRAIDVTTEFRLIDTVVHRTVFRGLGPHTAATVAGPQYATDVHFSGVDSAGLVLEDARFVFGVDVAEGGEVAYVVTDAVPEPTAESSPTPSPSPAPSPNPPPSPRPTPLPSPTPQPTPTPEPTPPPIAGGGGTPPPPDCNANRIDDAAELAAGSSLDCNSNGRPDECDLADGKSCDCNSNSIPDECDIANGYAGDYDSNGVPDECQNAPGDCDGSGFVDLADYAVFTSCLYGPSTDWFTDDQRCRCWCANLDGDRDIDLADFAEFTRLFGGPQVYARPPGPDESAIHRTP